MRGPFPVIAALVLSLLLAGPLAAHPQDGPHADIRLTIEEHQFRISAGLNLAFIDHAIGAEREALEAVAPAESEDIERRLSEALLAQVEVELNDVPVSGRIESFVLWTEPDATLAAYYPNTGMRALIRGVVVIDYRSDEPIEHLTLTWPFYPPDMITDEVAPGEQRPPMFLDTIVRAEGGVKLLRVSEPNPTVEWYPGDTDPESGFEDVPLPSAPPEPVELPGLLLLAAFVAVGGILVALMKLGPRSAVLVTAATIAGGLAVASVLMPGRFAVAAPWLAPPAAPPATDDQAAVFRALHSNLYAAFDFTSEDDVYDALSRSVSGPLLDEVYGQVYASLRQADQGGEQGIVTGVEPLGTESVTTGELLSISPTVDPQAFDIRHRWRVEGTVYHWGHSHSRTIEYLAAYRVAPVDGTWRISEQRILDQRILGAPPAPPEGEI